MCNNEDEEGSLNDEDAVARGAGNDDGGGSIVGDENEERVPRVARPPREPSRQEREQRSVICLLGTGVLTAGGAGR